MAAFLWLPSLLYANLILIFLFAVDDCGCVTRIWQPKASRFEEPQTWQAKRSPCFGDSVQLQENRAILISKQHTLSGLTLPVRGELIFGEGSVLEIIDLSEVSYKEQSGCPTQASPIRLMSSVNAKSWFDGSNWNSEADGQERLRIFLDSEGIPCNGDDVVLPHGHTFQIEMPSTLKEAVLLRSFKVGQLPMNDLTLAQYFSQLQAPQAVFDAASLLNLTGNSNPSSSSSLTTAVRDVDPSSTTSGTFIKIGQRNLEQWPCDEKYSCKCGNDRKEVMDQICRFVVPSSTQTTNCQEPVRAQGLCRPLCGSVVSVKVDSAAKAIETLRRVQAILEQLREDEDHALPDSVEDYTSLTYDNTIQTIFVPSPGNAKSDLFQAHRTAADLFRGKLTSDANKAWISSRSLTAYSSGGPQSSTHEKYINEQAAATSTGLIAGGISGLLLVLLIFLVAGWLFWRRRKQPFAFQTFASNEPLEMDGPNFINPLYPAEAGAINPNDRHFLEDDVMHRELMDFEDDDRAGLAENEF
ncbi:hypothetical protein BV898_11872 [Hypsibius exemplaris]|uniref:Protein amnionless n=1 Tax=Hypsibius exemplaris TaxID=2072580 RepID=A0A1W0WFA0_HYPEX|nr:hypothetical protein BV898_11872 [Hypsibius exemplaris]